MLAENTIAWRGIRPGPAPNSWHNARATGINDTIRIDATSCPDLVDDRIAVDQSSCEERSVRDLLFQPKDGYGDVSETRVDQRFLDRIDLVIGERHTVELRGISREEAANDIMRDSTEGVMAGEFRTL